MAKADQLDSLEEEMEETRERLADTIDQLVYRVSPKTVVRREVAAVRAFFLDPHGSPRTDNIVKFVGGLVGAAALVLVMRRAAR